MIAHQKKILWFYHHKTTSKSYVSLIVHQNEILWSTRLSHHKTKINCCGEVGYFTTRLQENCVVGEGIASQDNKCWGSVPYFTEFL